MDTKIELIQRLLAEKTQAVTLEIDSLTAAGRTDEANLRKAVRNIYGVLTTLLLKADSLEAFAQKLAKLRTPWEQARQLAADHDDFARVAVEDAKLTALKSIEDALQKEGVPNE